MSADTIRVLFVDADSTREDILKDRLAQLQGIESVGIAHNRRAALRLLEETRPDVMVIDLMLPGHRSIHVIEHVVGTQPEVKILAVSPADPVHDRIILALEAGALGYVCRGDNLAEVEAAVQTVHQGELWLPPQATYEVLKDAAPELGISSEERRNRLTAVVLGLLPLTGLIAALTALLWRKYWGHIGVRVADLGVDPTTRASEVFVSLLFLLGVFGPLLFVGRWLQLMGEWLETQPALSAAIERVRAIHLGRLALGRILFNRITAWAALATVVVLFGLLLARFADLLLILFVGPAVGVALLASFLGVDDILPRALQRGPLSKTALAMLLILVVLFLAVLGAEIWVKGPDLRTDGMHGIIAPQVLGLSAKPMTLYDLEGKHPPLGALYLGGNADLYVLYDPCAEKVRLVPVGASRVEMADEVVCESP
jgi:DNA-binding NarL/FixJ family response regulator